MSSDDSKASCLPHCHDFEHDEASWERGAVAALFLSNRMQASGMTRQKEQLSFREVDYGTID
jgi:hypothetical protein